MIAPAARRAHELSGEALLAGLGQRLEADEGQVEEGRRRDCEFDAEHVASVAQDGLEPMARAALGVEEAQAVAHDAVGHAIAGLRRRAAVHAEHQARLVVVADAEEGLAAERLDVLDRAVERAEEPVAVLPRAHVLRAHAHDHLVGHAEVEREPAGGREAHPGGADEAGDEHVGRRLVDRGGRVDLLEPPLVHDRDPVAHRHRLDLVVGDVDRRRPDLLLQPLDLAARLHPQLRVEVGERLVHQEDLRIAHERAPQRDPLLLAAGELARPALQQRVELERRRRRGAPARRSGPSASCAGAARRRGCRRRSSAGTARSPGRPSRCRARAGRRG